MPEKLQQVVATVASGAAVGAGTLCDPVYLAAITINDISLMLGFTAGLLSSIYWSIKIVKAIRSKPT